MIPKFLLFVSVAGSALYLGTVAYQPFPGSAAIKGCAVGALALMAWRSRGRVRKDTGLLALGLALAAFGDVLLDWDARMFALGLAAFLLTHLVYIAVFARNRMAGRGGLTRISAVVVVVIGAAALSIWIVPSVGALAVPVVLYLCALTGMVCSAIAFQGRWVAAGAVLFFISDSLLAIHKFKMPVPARDYLVWLTYYLGQCGIALGWLGLPVALGRA